MTQEWQVGLFLVQAIATTVLSALLYVNTKRWIRTMAHQRKAMQDGDALVAAHNRLIAALQTELTAKDGLIDAMREEIQAKDRLIKAMEEANTWHPK